MQFLLDTNIVSDMARNPRGIAARRFAQIGQHNIAISIVVAAELRFGIRRGLSIEQEKGLSGLLERLAVLPFESPADLHYAELRAALEEQGRPVGANDMLIAAHALALDCTLVTDNESEFSRVPGLNIENWLR